MFEFYWRWKQQQAEAQLLRKKCPYSELFWSVFFPHFPSFGLNMERNLYFSVFSPNVGKCGKNADHNNSEYGLFLGSAI